MTASVGESEMEDMDCEERWGDDGEVSMDFDVSEVQQEQLIAEITQTRETLLPTTTITSFDLLDTTTATYQVRTICVAHKGTKRSSGAWPA